MANNKLVKKNDERMTIQEVAKTIGCTPETIKMYVRELWPGFMRRGVTTYLTEDQMTIVLDRIKTPVASGHSANLQVQLVGVSTSKSRALRVARLNAEIQKELEAEIAELKASEHDLQLRLGEAQEWFTVKRVASINGIDWRSISWRELKEASDYMAMPIHKEFDANYGEVNSYHVSVFKHCYPELKYESGNTSQGSLRGLLTGEEK